MYEEFVVQSPTPGLTGDLWLMTQGDTIIVSSHCCAREYKGKPQEEMCIRVNGVDIRCRVEVRKDCNGVWASENIWSSRVGIYPKKDVSFAANIKIESMAMEVAFQFASKNPDKMLGGKLTSIEHDKHIKKLQLTRLEEEASGVRKEIQTLTDQWETTRKQLTEAEDNKAKAKAGGVT